MTDELEGRIPLTLEKFARTNSTAEELGDVIANFLDVPWDNTIITNTRRQGKYSSQPGSSEEGKAKAEFCRGGGGL